MIRILNKPLLKEWTTAQPFKQVTNSSRSFSGCRKAVPAGPYVLVRCNAPFPALRVARTTALYYSTVPGQTDVKTESDIPLPSGTISKKPKVDLRPAPKKPSRERSNKVVLPGPSSTTPQTTAVPSSITSAAPVASRSSPGRPKLQDIAGNKKHGVLQPAPEGASRIQALWHKAVQLFKFYWGGLKMIFITHRRQAADIRRKGAEAKAKGEELGITRWETRFLQTYNKDVVKLVPFILTLVILEEALPLVVLYAPGLLPSTCLLPSQRERIEEKRRAKQIVHLEGAKTELLNQSQRPTSSSTEKGVKSLSLGLARAISGALSCPTWGPLFLQQRRIQKRLAYIASDDALLVKEGLGMHLEEDELIEALEERGLALGSRTPQQLREQLQWWLKGAHDDKARLNLLLQAAIRGSDVQVKANI